MSDVKYQSQIDNQTMERRISIYPKSYYYLLILGYADAEDIQPATAVAQMVKEFFNHLPANAQAKYLEYGKEVLETKNKRKKKK